MVFRAIFWIGLVAILMPHEPDLGFGRPAAGALSSLTGWPTKDGAAQSAAALCSSESGACATTLSVLDSFKAVTAQNLAAVRADIERNGSVRLRSSGG